MRRQGFTLVELLVVIAIIALLMGILMPALSRVRQLAFRLTCGTNLSGLGKAMMLYANDYQDELPKAGARMNTWQKTLPNWVAMNRAAAYGITTTDNGNGFVTLSSNLYLLIRHAECTPKMFVCKGESDAKEFALKLFTGIPTTITDLQGCFDFGPGNQTNMETFRFCSYSYHMPFGAYALTTSSEAGMAVAADRNPWLPVTSTLTTPFNTFIPDLPGVSNTWKGTADQAKNGNSEAHQRDGQNVLFIDSHVDFEKRSFVGIEQDNLYTRFTAGTDQTQPDQKMLGVLPAAYSNVDPGSKRDSYLVNDTGMDPTVKGRFCFPADTPIWIGGSLAEISEAVAGQQVGRYDSIAPTIQMARIEKVQEHEGSFECRDIELSTGNRISVVDAHRFLLDSDQWVAAQDLKSGMNLRTLNGLVGIKGVATRATPFVGKVYNLKMRGTDHYPVGKDGVIVRDW